MGDFRKRSANFSEPEKTFLLKLIAEQQDVIESKKWDASTSRKKAVVWNQIAEIYNAEFETCRSTFCIRRFYENFKKRKRQKAKMTKDSFGSKRSNDGEEWSKRLKLQISEVHSVKLENAARVDETTRNSVLLKHVVLSSKDLNGPSPSKQRRFFLIERSQAESYLGLQNQLNGTEDDSPEEQASDSPEEQVSDSPEAQVSVSESMYSSGMNSNSVESSENSNISSFNDSKMFEDSVKHVATSTDVLTNTDEKQKDELHSLLCKEKKIQIQMLELDFLRRKLELLRDFPNSSIEK